MRARRASTSATTVNSNSIRARGFVNRALPKEDVISPIVSTAPLLAWAEIEGWRRDSLYIKSGYRPISNSYLKSFASLFTLHNETVNICTHMFGALAVPPTWYWVENNVMTRYSTTTWVDSMGIAAFFTTALICMSASTCYHTLMNHSRPVAAKCLLMDFFGILLFIIGSFYPGVFYGFYCSPISMLTYWTMITTLGLAAIIVIALPATSHPKYRSLRTLIFIGVALSGIVPVAHGIFQHGATKALWDMGAIWYLIEGLFYLFGAWCFSIHIPESFKPGTFDIVGHSHQIMHVSVLLGALSHLRAVLIGLDFNHNPMTRQC